MYQTEVKETEPTQVKETAYDWDSPEGARDRLLKLLKPGDTVYTKLNHVSRSGMLRSIDVYIFRDNAPLRLTYDVGLVTGYKHHKDGGLKLHGCGMDMGFSLVYNLSRALYGSGYACIEDQERGIRCPSAFHVNTRDKTIKEPIHKDGYALNHRWM